MSATFPSRASGGIIDLIDVCASSKYVYIIRSDLGCYMRCNGHLDYIDEKQKLEIFPLNPSCAGGDHYLIARGHFYIIRGDAFIYVNDLSQPEGVSGVDVNTVYPLHSSCQNGVHYFFADNKFVIVTRDYTYKIVSDLTTGSDAVTGNISKGEEVGSVNNLGQYYFGPPPVSSPSKAMGIIRQVDKWGAKFTYTAGLDQQGKDYFINPDIVNFILGGLSVTFGPAISSSTSLLSFENTSRTEITWSNSMSRGYNKSRFSSIASKWIIDEAKFSRDHLVQAIIEAQLSLPEASGGVNIMTHLEDWNELHQTEDDIKVVIPPGVSVAISQVILGLGKTAVLFCRNLEVTSTGAYRVPLPKGTSKSKADDSTAAADK